MAMSISELARGGGVGVETVRYYQRRGLLFDPQPSLTRPTGRRHYGPDELRRLRFIRGAQRAGFSLDEIAELLALDSTSERARARELARARIAELDTKIAEMQQARRSLEKLARECASGSAGPCPIITAFEQA
ncbi:MAG TPA: MerR family DNA-binding protein [Novosphingobium sp.]|nr:MerR family DNA-binding protein [Novosphingobium sp.]